MPFLLKKEVEKPPFSELSEIEKLRLYKPLAALKPTIHWRYTSFNGNPFNDSLGRIFIKTGVPTVQASVGSAEGIQVHFYKGATYGNMVYLLDMMRQLHQEDYWFDIRSQTFTFYIVSE